MNEVLEIVKDLTGKKLKIKQIEKKKGDVKDTFSSNQLSKKILGYNPRYNISDGLSSQLDWMKSNLKLFQA
ncbi:MAG: hypothetical protein PHV06_10795 [bacterium]|nr:hypothetical protein [bacterium]